MTEDAKQHLVDNWLKTQISKSNTTYLLNGVMENQRRTGASLDANADMAERNYNPLGFVEAEKAKEEAGLQTTEQTANNIEMRSYRMRDKAQNEIGSEINDLLKQGKPQEAKALFEQDSMRMKFLQSGSEYWYKSTENAIDKAITYQGYEEMMATTPDVFLAELKKARAGEKVKLFDGASQAELLDLENKTYQVIQGESNKVTYDAKNAVESGTLISPAGLNDPHYNKMSPVDKKVILYALEDRRINGTKLNEKAWMSFATGMTSIEPNTPKGKLEAAQMKNFIGILFPGKNLESYRQALEDMLDTHMKGSSSDADNQAQKILLDTFKAGGFGVTEVPYDPGRKPGIMSGIMAGLTGDPSWLESRDPTSLTPEDQARLNQPDKIAGEKNRMKLKPGMPVIDQKAWSNAQKILFDAQLHVSEMRKQGKTDKEIMEYALQVRDKARRDPAFQSMVKPQSTPAPATQRLQKATDLLNKLPEPSNTLFPSN